MDHYTTYFSCCKGVFQGGGCKAIAYIGAYREAYERGVIFSELAGTSAGALIAALIAAGATPDYLENVVRHLQFDTFISSPKSLAGKTVAKVKQPLKWLLYKICVGGEYPSLFNRIPLRKSIKNYGAFDSQKIEELVDTHLSKLTGNRRKVTFQELIPNLYIVCADLETHSVKIWCKETTPNEPVSKAVRCSCSIPFFFRPVDRQYVDGGILSNLPNFIFSQQSHSNRILNLRLVESKESKRIEKLKEFTSSLIDTVIEGSCHLQQTLVDTSFIVNIQTSNISSVDFDKIDSQKIDELIGAGKSSMQHFLDNEATFSPSQRHVKITLSDKEELRSLVAYLSLNPYKEVHVLCENTYWSWELFLSLVRWIENGASVFVYTLPVQEGFRYVEEEKSRRRMLVAMGVGLNERASLPMQGYFFKERRDEWMGVAMNREDDNQPFAGVHYSGIIDSLFIKELILRMQREERGNRRAGINFMAVPTDKIIERIKEEPIYRAADIQFEKVDIESLQFMNPYIRALKYRQIDLLFQKYKKKELKPFSPSAFYFGKKESLVGPPVVEEHNGRFYVIEGNTRFLYAYKHGIRQLHVLVVRNVTQPIPCDINHTYRIQDIRLSDKKVAAEQRYKDFDYHLFRHIEQNLRPYNTYMM